MKIIIKTTAGVYIMLCELHKNFEKILEHIGVMKSLPTALFYETPFGIHFEIGSFKRIYLHKGINPVYLRSAFYRARTLFDDLPVHPNILRIDVYQYDLNKIVLKEVGLSEPDEIIKELIKYDNYKSIQYHLYWDLRKIKTEEIYRLLLEIIKADIGGFNFLASNVYFANTDYNLLYHLYDDRGAYIVAENKSILYSLYKEYNAWIFQYDRERIGKIFNE